MGKIEYDNGCEKIDSYAYLIFSALSTFQQWEASLQMTDRWLKLLGKSIFPDFFSQGFLNLTSITWYFFYIQELWT